jgi:hypothetical protein
MNPYSKAKASHFQLGIAPLPYPAGRRPGRPTPFPAFSFFASNIPPPSEAASQLECNLLNGKLSVNFSDKIKVSAQFC